MVLNFDKDINSNSSSEVQHITLILTKRAVHDAVLIA